MQYNSHFKILFYLSVCCCACNSPEKNKDDEKKDDPVMKAAMYKDIDPFTLTGVNEIKDPSSYPYIKIEERKDTKRLVYMITRIDSTENIYEIISGGWTTNYLTKFGTNSQKVYEYILPGHIIDLTYLGTKDEKDLYLFKASEMKGDTINTYFTPDDTKLVIDPHPGAIDSLKERIPVVVTDKMEVEGDVLRTIVTHFNKTENKITYSDTACFSGGKRSWFWFRHFSGQLTLCN